ncbi:2-phosphosulfolactate phosphatase [Curtobacterium ammoniigenes]|uniref:2-phosphosulfolactate phosphatase n=1 Tax=Curtobacterium ammoniigenes TaxID=395387 RepID=UPI0009F9ADA9|nr:2-phosphosulfolactate phosphatase [Curtobacterium ammoniigenes]
MDSTGRPGAAQARYQVRFAWGAAGATRVATDAHLLVWVDVLPDPSGAVAPEPDPSSIGSAEPTEVLAVGLTDGTVVVDRVMRLQAERGDRCVVAVVAAGHHGGYAVEDQLAAGAVIDALVRAGIDHTAPEAAAAAAVWSGLRGAAKHLVSASESAAALDAAGRRDLVDAAIGRGRPAGRGNTAQD